MRGTWWRWITTVSASAAIVTAGCSWDSVRSQEQAGNGDTSKRVGGLVTTNSIGMRLVCVPAGEFRMGSGGAAAELAARYGGKPAHFANEFPQHRVRITKGFWMGQTEVTQGEYRAVMNAEPWREKPYVEQADWNPAVFVSWTDAVEFCRRLSEQEGRTYTLPTEAQWEYACRAGTTAAYSFDDVSGCDDYAWFKGNTVAIGEARAHPVALLKPNAFGLYDMHGNVWEWCRDYYHSGYYSRLADPAVDPENTQPAAARVLRGGCWYYEPQYGRSSYRGGSTPPGRRNARIGFRVILLDGEQSHAAHPERRAGSGQARYQTVGEALAVEAAEQGQQHEPEEHEIRGQERLRHEGRCLRPPGW